MNIESEKVAKTSNYNKSFCFFAKFYLDTQHAAGTYENDAFLKGVVSLSISAHTPFIAAVLELARAERQPQYIH
jgi:hypothetical protein